MAGYKECSLCGVLYNIHVGQCPVCQCKKEILSLFNMSNEEIRKIIDYQKQIDEEHSNAPDK